MVGIRRAPQHQPGRHEQVAFFAPDVDAHSAELVVVQLDHNLCRRLETLALLPRPSGLAGPWRCRLIARRVASHPRGEGRAGTAASRTRRVGPVSTQRERAPRQPRGGLGDHRTCEVERGRSFPSVASCGWGARGCPAAVRWRRPRGGTGPRRSRPRPTGARRGVGSTRRRRSPPVRSGAGRDGPPPYEPQAVEQLAPQRDAGYPRHVVLGRFGHHWLHQPARPRGNRVLDLEEGRWRLHLVGASSLGSERDLATHVLPGTGALSA